LEGEIKIVKPERGEVLLLGVRGGMRTSGSGKAGEETWGGLRRDRREDGRGI